MRRLEEDHRAGFLRESGQPRRPLPRLARQEALEAEAVARQPGDHQRGRHLGRPRQDGDRHLGLDRGGDEPVSRIGHARESRVGDDEHVAAVAQLVQELGGAGESRRREVHVRLGFPPYDVGVVAMTGLEPAASQSQRDRRPPSLRQWMAPAIPGSRLMGWVGPLVVTLFAGLLRFYDLAKPRAVIFDETYYAKDAYALLRFGYEHNTVKNADKLLLQDPPDYHIWANGGSFVAHPPAGKWLIAIGEWMFGMTPFGWRFSAALIGTLSVQLLARVARRMTRSTLLGSAAGLLLAVDGMHLVTSRTAILAMVAVSGVTYLAWWSGWIFNAGGWGRGRVSGNPITALFQAMPKLLV